MPDTITTAATDMSEHWRLINAEGQSDTYRVHGVWWVSEANIKPVDVTIWSRRGNYGRVFYSGDLTAFIRDGVVDLPKHMVRSDKLADAEDAWDLLLAVIGAAAAASWKPIAKETNDEH